MSILVLASLGEPSCAQAFLHLLEGASTVLGPSDTIEIAPLGTYEREARGKTETVCAALIKEADVFSQGDASTRARSLESVLKAMLSAGRLADCDVRVLAVAPGSNMGFAAARVATGATNT